ncbi:TPA: anaerobic sulfatase maturase [Vibrio vulnificus]|uniref:anaerobic sulfatase maturase n=1 Tax=Vibrio vulnificus TaxID=672 RepID=UPI001A322A94|nr:anaerobic sulfatase maturase [Vibrio vulnificus]EGQ8175651.1 anaerobic sulfatase maturase [Vibrio vulnificus]EID4424474.1 anaerobic sulfatase maturase [Vibrio vulnificus]EJB8416755.1 anaerobic sulfatase maturase [Vibrio vulnificus]MCG6293234.1 anaerobic sulfatase maturase [Vibrio vulnificus]MCG6301186.1 anaerobic sulfatase maturase [Vibrio vulnificus]
MNQPPQARFHMMAKPASYRCNLKCDYCFYLEKETLLQGESLGGGKSPQASNPSENMSDTLLKRYVRDYIHSQDSDSVDFAWQGGEPTLAGLDFYKKLVKYQAQYAGGKTITNSFQTNAIAINRQWAEFFARHNFLIGVSIDGLAEVHDKYRISVNGKPTFARVKQAIDLLKEYQVEFNTLTVINDQNWQYGKETYHALKQLGSQFMQFIPIVEVEAHCQQGQKGHYSPVANAKLTHFSVPAHGYGQFMTDVFDEWVKEDIGTVYVRMFDSILATWMGYPASVCVQSKQCGQAMILESNGDVYSCDHYVYPANKLGNISQTNIALLATGKQQQRFGKAKHSKLTSICQQCELQALCYGGCPKHRIDAIEGEKHKHNYLCASYQRIFNHTAPAMHLMSQEIQAGGVAASVMPMLRNL